jgi:putative SOS response-associated peptidase YedK
MNIAQLKDGRKKFHILSGSSTNLYFLFRDCISVAELPDSSTGEMIKRWTYTLITRDANELMSKIHNSGENKGRMPLIVPLAYAMAFLKDKLSVDEYQDILRYEMPSDEMDYHPVFTIRSPKQRPDELKKTDYWEWQNLPELGVADPD